MCLVRLTEAKTSAEVDAVISSEPSWRILGLLGDRRPCAFFCSSLIKCNTGHFLSIRQHLHELLCICLCCPSLCPFILLSCPVLCSIFFLPPLFLPFLCNKSQPVYNPLGAVHNYSGSNCRSIYIRQCRGLASLMEVCVSSECIFHDLTA